MNHKPRVVLLTGNGLRHRYVAQHLAGTVRLVGIVSETKAPVMSATGGLPAEDQAVIERHFAERDAVEEKAFGSATSFPSSEIRLIAHGTVNSPDVVAWIHSLLPDFLVLYGSGIVKATLLTLYQNRIINMHLGLSPYYRGSGTNFWPLVKGEPECVGATIHLAVPHVDAGPILTQVRPDPDPSDRIHELGCKAIAAGARALSSAINLHAAEKLSARSQDISHGRLFRNRDFNAEAVRSAWCNLSNGMMADYISNREPRCQKFSIHCVV